MPSKSRSKLTKRRNVQQSDETRAAASAVVDLVEQFCREHLNQDYVVLCRKLAELLARARPSPLLTGKPEGWASAIVQTIGSANFLQDPSQSPHMTIAEIARAFGVGESTSHAKAKVIRQIVDISRIDPDWLLPSRREASPLTWLLEVNGVLMDIRVCPREAQVVAYEQGLIPYIPADRNPGEDG